MNIVMQYGINETYLSHFKWDIAFIGTSIDDRCTVSKKYIHSNALKILEVLYNPSDYNLKIDEEVIDVDSLDDYFIEKGMINKNIVIDSTSVGVAEYLVIIQSLYNIGNKIFDVLYLEPQKYRNPVSSFTENRDFELSLSVDGYIGIPGQSLAFERTDKAVFFCGYESERLDRTFEELDITGRNTQLIFGIPPFNAGWDMNSYSNHISVIEKQNISKQFYYCGAANPIAVCEKLDLFYNSLADNERLFIIPLGTKPMAIGACTYKVSKNDNQKLSILYDHPIRKEERSSKIAKWNLYNITL